MLPTHMTAIEIQNGQLIPVQRPLPVPGPDEVLIRVHAASVNRPDLLQRQGLYPPPPGITDILGLDVAGEVVETGTPVCALVAGGGYAEYCVAPRATCLPIPQGFDFIQAASLPETFFTVWRNLIDIGQLQKGESVLIHGGTSGIGTAAIQIAHYFCGAKVLTTAGSAEKCAAALKIGAEVAINYRSQDFVAEVMKLTGDKGINLILDMVGGDYLPRNLKILASEGRHVSIAALGGRAVKIDILEIMRKQVTITGSTLRTQPLAIKSALAHALQQHIWPLLEKKMIKPIIYQTFPLTFAQKAHDTLEKDPVIGKIILTPSF